MAFSYSDNNFTVIGNLCFVHIPLDGTKDTYEIPPAIADRMVSDSVVSIYPYRSENKSSRGEGQTTLNIGFAIIRFGEIFCPDVGDGFLYGYLSLFFPIDSNK